MKTVGLILPGTDTSVVRSVEIPSTGAFELKKAETSWAVNQCTVAAQKMSLFVVDDKSFREEEEPILAPMLFSTVVTSCSLAAENFGPNLKFSVLKSGPSEFVFEWPCAEWTAVHIL